MRQALPEPQIDVLMSNILFSLFFNDGVCLEDKGVSASTRLRGVIVSRSSNGHASPQDPLSQEVDIVFHSCGYTGTSDKIL